VSSKVAELSVMTQTNRDGTGTNTTNGGDP